MVLSNSFWPGMCAFLGVFFAMLVVVEFSAYVGMRYRERFLSEASIELDDVLIQMPAGRVLDISLALSCFVLVGVFLFLSVWTEEISMGWCLAGAFVIGAAAFPLPRLYLRYLRRRRLAKFNSQLEDALGMISSSLKAGFSISQALEEVADQNIHPISVEFRLLVQELRLGVPLEQALGNMTGRLESDDFELVATAILTARQTGGELTGALERVAGLVRERVRIANKVRALTAMGRLQALMIGAMPFVLLVGMSYVSPVMMHDFLHSPIGVAAVVVVVILVTCGFLMIRRIMTIEV